MKQRIRVAAILVKEGKVLLVKHVHPKTKYQWWVSPGGGLEATDDSIYECVIREAWEEIKKNNIKTKYLGRSN